MSLYASTKKLSIFAHASSHFLWDLLVARLKKHLDTYVSGSEKNLKLYLFAFVITHGISLTDTERLPTVWWKKC